MLGRLEQAMSTLVLLRQSFDRASKDCATDAALQVKPSLMIEDQTFQEIFGPIAEVFQNGRLYSENGHMGVPETILEMYSMCSEAFSKEPIDEEEGYEVQLRREELKNILHSTAETAKDHGVDQNGMRLADIDFFSLPDFLDLIRYAAVIQRRSLHNGDVYKALNTTADEIKAAEKRLWRPRGEGPKVMPADDYASQEVSEEKLPQGENLFDTIEDTEIGNDGIADDYDSQQGLDVA